LRDLQLQGFFELVVFVAKYYDDPIKYTIYMLIGAGKQIVVILF
jgi:hypothetical protein